MPAKSEQTSVLRTQLVEFLRGGSAHADVKTALKGVPEAHYGARLKDTPHTLWELLEHLRFTLRDLLDFCTNPEYAAPAWPDDYWPGTPAPADKEAWKHAADGLLADLAAFEALVEDPSTDLEAKIPWGQGQSVLREVLLAIDHTSYHVGQFILIRKQLGDWKG